MNKICRHTFLVLFGGLLSLQLSFAEVMEEYSEESKQVVQTMASMPIVSKIAAQQAASDLIGTIDRESVLRWEPVSIDPVSVLAKVPDAGLIATTNFDPAEKLSFTLFPDIEFTAENTNFYVDSMALTWLGKIIEGGKGTVTVYVLRQFGVCQIHILSNKGNFNVAPTDIEPFYVVMEANQEFNLPMD